MIRPSPSPRLTSVTIALTLLVSCAPYRSPGCSICSEEQPEACYRGSPDASPSTYIGTETEAGPVNDCVGPNCEPALECAHKRLTEQAAGPCTFSSAPSPSPCAAARDCPAVCCVAGDDGLFRPALLSPPTEDDGGDADGGPDAGASADAAADVDLDASPSPLGTMTGWACAYCRCRSPEETCSLLQAGAQDGGP